MSSRSSKVTSPIVLAVGTMMYFGVVTRQGASAANWLVTKTFRGEASLGAV